MTVQFKDESTGFITAWAWTFGDGSPDDWTENPSHTYGKPGNYTVTLRIAGAGGTLSKSIAVQVLAPAVPPILGPIQLLPQSGTVQGTVAGNPGQTYVIEASTNLVDWVRLTIQPTSTSATVPFADLSAPNFSRRFYRAVSP